MFCRFFVLLFVVFLIATLFSCGVEKEEILLGEEVVVEKWIDPTDIGKEYLPEAEIPKVGDTVFLSKGGQLTITKSDVFDIRDRGTFIYTLTNLRPDPEDPGAFLYDEEILRGYVVPEGLPVVSLYSKDLLLREGFSDTRPHHPQRSSHP